MMAIVSKRFTFEASHVLPKHPGKCSRIHGHSWVLTVFVTGPVNPETGFVVDFAELKAVVNLRLINLVDHQHLGQGKVEVLVPGPKKEGTGGTGETFNRLHFPAVLGESFYPSSENLVYAFWKILNPFIKELRVSLYRLELEETCTSKAILTQEIMNGWI